jgi:hypothetical protein
MYSYRTIQYREPLPPIFLDLDRKRRGNLGVGQGLQNYCNIFTIKVLLRRWLGEALVPKMWQIFTSKFFRVPGVAMCACNSRTIFWNSYSKGLVHNILTKMYNSGSKWDRLLVFELWEDEPLMSCRLCHFPNGEGENIGEILCFGVRCQLLGGPPWLLHWFSYWFLLVNCSSSNITL